MDPRAIYPWNETSRQEVFRCRIFTVDACHMVEQSDERPQKEADFFVLRAPDWVNVVALTDDEQLVMIEQYRPGTDSSTLEIAGGMVEEGEAPEAAAVRELREETGFACSRWVRLGSVEPNPAIQDNTCHTYLGVGARRVQAPDFDSNERIRVKLLPLTEALQACLDGRITHALVVAALMHTHLQPQLWKE